MLQPASQILAPSALLESLRFEQTKRKAEGSLIEFTQQAWEAIEPGTQYVDGWHLHAIADHLEAVLDGEIRDLIINMPPRHMKSIQVAVMWPVWSWIAEPNLRWLFSSYAGSLSVRDSLKCRRLIQSPWFQDRWGHVFQLTGDQNAKTFFENDRYGYRFATSVGASTTGHGGDIIVCDDPHNAIEAQSDTIRETTIEWWSQAMSTRLNNPQTGRRVVVMQRLHENDLTGHLLKEQGWEHLCLPAEYEGRRVMTSVGWTDPRKKEGELLWPERFDRVSIDKLKKQLGTYGAAGQLQQRPAPSEGGLLRRSWFHLWQKDEPKLKFILQSYDTAFTEKTSGDPTACTVYGVFAHEGRYHVMVLDTWAEHLDYPSLRKKVADEWAATYLNGYRPDLVLIEQKGSGQSLIQDLRRLGISIATYNPGRADKVTRVHRIAPLLEAGLLFVPESKKFPGQPMTWAQKLIDQAIAFPNAEHDDLVDTMSQALIYLQDAGYLSLTEDAMDTTPRKPREPVINPYAA